jgi:hypothetical protein
MIASRGLSDAFVERCRMKSCWIVAAIVAVLFTAGARESKAFVTGWQQSVTDARPAEQAQSPGNAAETKDSGKPQASSEEGAGLAAQTKAETPTPATKSVFYILAEFTRALNVKKLKPGDRIKAEVTQDVLSHGKIVIPVESKLVGHVTEVKARSGEDPESRLGFVFDKVLLKHHHELDFQGVIQAISPPATRRSKVDEPDQMLPPLGAGPSQANVPMGGSGRSTAGSPAPSMATTIATMPTGVPVSVHGTPSSNVGNSSSMDLGSSSAKEAHKPMSAGMPRGVFGLKGLSLSPGPGSSTPGPVILSEASNVKLEYGTQVLLKVTDVTVP